MYKNTQGIVGNYHPDLNDVCTMGFDMEKQSNLILMRGKLSKEPKT